MKNPKMHGLVIVAIIALGVGVTSVTAQAQSALTAWASLPKGVRDCMSVALRRNNQTLEAVIASGVLPTDARLSDAVKTCRQFVEGLPADYQCKLKLATGEAVETICTKYYAVREGSGYRKITKEEAFRDAFTARGNDTVYLDEETEAGRRQREDRIRSALGSVPADQPKAEVAKPNEVQKPAQADKAGPSSPELQIVEQLYYCTFLAIARHAAETNARKLTDQQSDELSTIMVGYRHAVTEYVRIHNIAAARVREQSDAAGNKVQEFKAVGEQKFLSAYAERNAPCIQLLAQNADVKKLVEAGAELQRRSFQAQTSDTRYRVTLTCGVNGRHINSMGCFSGGRDSAKTELELRNGGEYRLYQIQNIRSLGEESPGGLQFDLREKVSIKAQNASPMLLLTLKIVDVKTNQVVFEKSVSQYGVISVKNE